MFPDWIVNWLEYFSLLTFFLIYDDMKPSRFRLILYIAVSLILSCFFSIMLSDMRFLHCILMLLILVMVIRPDIIQAVDQDRISCIIHAMSSMFSWMLIEYTAYSLMPMSFLEHVYGDLLAAGIMYGLSLFVYGFAQKAHAGPVLSEFLDTHKVMVLLLIVLIMLFSAFFLSGLSDLYIYLPGISALMLCILLFYALLVYIRYQRSADRLKIQMLTRDINSTEAFITTLRVQNHDHKHHIQHLNDMIQTADHLEVLKRETSQYVEQLNEDRAVMNTIISIEQPVFRSFLYGSYVRCLKEQIPFYLKSTALLPAFPLKEYQWVEVMENLVSNAIEHNLTLPVEKRYIRIILAAVDMSNEITIENPTNRADQPISDYYLLGQSTKTEFGHGLGLPSILGILNTHGMELVGIRDPEGKSIAFTVRYETKQNV